MHLILLLRQSAGFQYKVSPAAGATNCLYRHAPERGTNWRSDPAGRAVGRESIPFNSAQPALASGSFGRKTAPLRTDILAVEELIAFGLRLEREFSNLTRLRLTIDQPPAFRGLHPLAHVDGQGRCAIRNGLVVLSSGEYALCGVAESIPEFILGTVGVDALGPIWQAHPTLAALRGGLPDQLEGVCGRCIMKTACLGFCPAENYLRSGSFWGPHWFCQAAERAGLFPASRLIENRW